MIGATYAVFFLGVALVIASAALALVYLRSADARILAAASRLTLAGGACLALTFLLRLVMWRHVPLSTAVDSLNLFAVLTAFAAFSISRGKRITLLAIYLPPLALLCIVTGFTAVPALGAEPPELSGMLLLTHVGLVFAAFALFFVASLTSLAYLDQVRRLKTHKTSGLFQRLPSLENLDQTLFHLITIGYPVFVVSLILGVFWAWYEPDQLSRGWWLSPKIILSVCMCLVYAFCFHARRAGWLRGPKLAYLMFIGGGSLIGIFVFLRAMDWSTYNFLEVTL